MNQKEIYQALKDKKLNAAIIAEALNVSTQAVAAAIRKGRGSERIAKAIAIALDKPLEDVFPHYANKDNFVIARAEKVNELKTQFSQLN